MKREQHKLIQARIELFLAIIIGGFLVLAGVGKSQTAFAFLQSVLAYGIVTGPAATAVATALPAVEIAAGAALLTRTWLRSAWTLVAALSVIFVAAQVYAMASGKDISCGCFGTTEERIGIASLARSGAILAASLWVLLVPFRTRQQDIEPAPAHHADSLQGRSSCQTV